MNFNVSIHRDCCVQNVFIWTKIFCNRIKLVEKNDKEKPLVQYSQEEGIPFQLVHTRPLDKTHTELNYVDHTHYSAAQLPDQPTLHCGPKSFLKLHNNSQTPRYLLKKSQISLDIFDLLKNNSYQNVCGRHNLALCVFC